MHATPVLCAVCRCCAVTDVPVSPQVWWCRWNVGVPPARGRGGQGERGGALRSQTRSALLRSCWKGPSPRPLEMLNSRPSPKSLAFHVLFFHPSSGARFRSRRTQSPPQRSSGRRPRGAAARPSASPPRGTEPRGRLRAAAAPALPRLWRRSASPGSRFVC